MGSALTAVLVQLVLLGRGWLIRVVIPVLTALLFLGAGEVRTSSAANTRERLTLSDAIALAQERSRSVLHAKADVLLADVEVMRSFAPILPSFDVALTATEDFIGSPIVEQRTQSFEDVLRAQLTGAPVPVGPFRDFQLSSSSDPNFQVALTARQLIYDGGRWWTVIARAGDIEVERKAALRAIENDARLGAAQRFWELAKAIRSKQTIEDQIQVDIAQVERVQALLAQGMSRLNDVAQVQRNLSEDRISLARRAYAVRAAERALNLAMGRSFDHEYSIVVNDEVFERDTSNPRALARLPDRSGLVRLAHQHRPELARARAALEISRKNVDIARADYYPIVSLGASYGRQSRKPERVFDDPTENYFAAVNLQMRWNVFNGRATTAAVEQAEIELNKLETQFEEDLRLVGAEVAARADDLDLAIDVYTLAQESRRSADEAVRLARGLYEAGRGTLLELRDSELRSTVQKLAGIEASIDLEIARETVLRAVGTPIDSDIGREVKE